MTTLPDRPNTALMVIDVQNDIVADAAERDAVVANIASLVERARNEQTPIVWVQHSDDDLEKGSHGWNIVPELKPDASESLVLKNYMDAFEATELESVLSDHAVGRLVVTGASTDACIRSTIHGAFTRGYDVLLVEDAHTTDDIAAPGVPSAAQVIAHTNLYWRHQQAPGKAGGVVPTAGVVFAA
ncbi:MAG TPA: isochorismatase family protein [Candidatus Stackebrandtia excrementipullorum]|nr:isochorismatase family protein [Candidatus Stackebrandtia excrementipullorum]